MPVIQNNISGKCLFIADSNSHIFHIPCRPWQANPEMCIHRLYKSRAIRSFCQTGTAPYVRISNKLTGVIYDSLSRSSLILHNTLGGSFLNLLCFLHYGLLWLLRLFCFPRLCVRIRCLYTDILPGYPAGDLPCLHRIPSIFWFPSNFILLILHNLCQNLCLYSLTSPHIQNISCYRCNLFFVFPCM